MAKMVDLEDDTRNEDALRKYLKSKYKFNKNNKFDIDLEFGERFEYSLAKILTIGKIEVKTERDKWMDTGNIAIELMNQNKLSGLTVTKAEWWAQILTYKNEIKGIILIPVEELKIIVKKIIQRDKGRITMGGDGNKSELALIPLKEIYENF